MLTYFETTGAVPDEISASLRAVGRIERSRVVHQSGEVGWFEVVVRGDLSKLLAGYGAVVTGLTATSRKLTITGELPAHVDGSTVINRFIEEYPAAELTARRQTDRRTPSVSETQFVTDAFAKLTDRQEMVLRTAFASGYFEFPRECTGTELAESLGVAPPTFHDHLRTAQRKVLEFLIDAEEQRRGGPELLGTRESGASIDCVG